MKLIQEENNELINKIIHLENKLIAIARNEKIINVALAGVDEQNIGSTKIV